MNATRQTPKRVSAPASAANYRRGSPSFVVPAAGLFIVSHASGDSAEDFKAAEGVLSPAAAVALLEEGTAAGINKGGADAADNSAAASRDDACSDENDPENITAAASSAWKVATSKVLPASPPSPRLRRAKQPNSVNKVKRGSGHGNKMLRIWQHRASPTPPAAAAAEPASGGKKVERKEGGPLIENTFTDLHSKYVVDDSADELGSGQYGVVRQCISKQTGEALAVKTIPKSKVKGNPTILRHEVALLREVGDHPHILKLVEVFEDQDCVHLVTELCHGGELFDRIVARRRTPQRHFTEYESARMIRQILDALSYCHDEHDIVHRDLKPENFLFDSNEDDANIKIIDFGYARRHTPSDRPMKDEVGTPLYMAPEVMHHKYTRSADIWSVGIIAYTLLCGFPPFNGATEKDIYNSVKEGRFRFIAPYFDGASPEALDFVCKVLKKDKKTRITARDALQHDWIQKFAPTEEDRRKVEEDESNRRAVLAATRAVLSARE